MKLGVFGLGPRNPPESPAFIVSEPDIAEPSVAILLPTLRVGGAEKVLIELANGLARHEWPVQVLTMSAEGPLADNLSPRVEIVDLACATYRRAVVALARHYARARPQIVLTSVYATGLAAIAAKAISGYKPKVVIGAHNSLRSKVSRPDNLKDRYLLLPLCQALFPWADAFVPVSQGLAQELQAILRLPDKKVRVIYNPVVSPQLLAQAGEPLDHPWLGDSLVRDFKTLVSVGRLVEQKGFDVLLKAFARVSDGRDCRLIIVGDGPLRPELQALAEELGMGLLVDFVGLQDNPYKFVSRADLFVLSSRWEGLGNVLIEALACGCPVVATDCKFGPSEILGGGAYGRLVPIDDPGALAICISEALTSNKTNLQARALDFTVEQSVEQYIIFFKEIIEKHISCGKTQRAAYLFER
jgi:glycosyltransferase involved in cell wall biosynthesis